VTTFYALATGLDIIEKEGIPQIFERHARIARLAREGIKSLGLSLFPDEAYASNTITAVKGPEGVDVEKLRRILREEYQVVLAGGQRTLSGKIFRIGHLGWVSEEDIKEVLEKLKVALTEV
jgi:aspartate aminotransferase-like enzyme